MPDASLEKDLRIVMGEQSHEFFGVSIVSSSANPNKEMGFIIGSPGAGRSGGPQEGIARMHFNEFNESVSFRGGMSGGNREQFPSYERFGSSSAYLDLNSDGILDVVICAPSFGAGHDVDAAVGNYSGRCDLFIGPFIPNDILVHVPTLSIYGDKDWGNFGLAIATGDLDGDLMDDLIISAPYAGRYRTFLLFYLYNLNNI